MSVAGLLAELARRGVELKAEGGRLRYRPVALVDDDLRARLREHREALILALARTKPPAVTPPAEVLCSVRAADWWRDALRLIEAWPVEGDREALRMRLDGAAFAAAAEHVRTTGRRPPESDVDRHAFGVLVAVLANKLASAHVAKRQGVG